MLGQRRSASEAHSQSAMESDTKTQDRLGREQAQSEALNRTDAMLSIWPHQPRPTQVSRTTPGWCHTPCFICSIRPRSGLLGTYDERLDVPHIGDLLDIDSCHVSAAEQLSNASDAHFGERQTKRSLHEDVQDGVLAVGVH